MIQKILPTINSNKFEFSRAILKGGKSKLKNLAGSSMSNWNTPKFEPTEMIIPGGLDFKEKAFYLLTKKFPKSVTERWFPKSSDSIANNCDEIVTVNIADGKYIGNVLDEPHNYISDDSSSIIDDITGTDSPNFWDSGLDTSI